MTSMITGHTVKRFDGELGNLHKLVLDIGDLVRNQLHRAVNTLEDEDPKTAREVINRDNDVNALDPVDDNFSLYPCVLASQHEAKRSILGQVS